MKYQIDFYQKAFSDYIEFDYVNGPFQIDFNYDSKITEKFDGPFYSWGDLNMDEHRMDGAIDAMNLVIDYINQNGPYDGVFGFSQGTLICRLLLKNKELSKYATKLNYPLKFGILVAGPSYYHLNPFIANPEDYNILHTKYEQPLFYLYGMNDPLISYIKKCVVHEGDYVEFLHGGKHIIPRLVGDSIKPLVKFLAKIYTTIYQTPFQMTQEIDEQFEVDYFKDFQAPSKAKI